MRISSSIFLKIAGICVASVALGIGLEIWARGRMSEVIIEHEMTDLKDDSTVDLDKVREALFRSRADVFALQRNPQVIEALRTRKPGAARLLDEIAGHEFPTDDTDLRRKQLYREVALVRPDGIVVERAPSNDATLPANLANEPWFAAAMARTGLDGKPPLLVSDLVPDAGDTRHGRAIWVAGPVDSGESTPLGMAAVRIDLDVLLEEIETNARLLSFITDRDGKFVTRPAGLQGAAQTVQELFPALEGHFGHSLEEREFNRALLKDKDHRLTAPIERWMLIGFTEKSVDRYFKDRPDLVTAATSEAAAEAGIHHAQWLASAAPGSKQYQDALNRKYNNDLHAAMQELEPKYPDLRYPRWIKLVNRQYFSVGSKAAMDDIARLLDEVFHLELGEPFQTTEYALHFSKLPLDPRDPQQFMTVSRAASYQEIDADIAYETAHIRSACWILGLLTVAFGIALSFYITSPLQQVTRAIARVAQNDFDTQLPENRHDEIGDLAKSVRMMSLQIVERDTELRERAARNRAILTMAADGIITVGEGGGIENFNRAAEQMFGYTVEEIRGQPFDVLWDGAESLRGTIRKLMVGLPQSSFESSISPSSDSSIKRSEATCRRKDGTQFPVALAISEVYTGGHRLQTVIVRDITLEKAQAEERLRVEAEIRSLNEGLRLLNESLDRQVQQRTAQLEEQNNTLQTAKDELERARVAREIFIASVSHELRNPLNHVLGSAQLLESTPLNDKQHVYIKRILDACDHLNELTSDILDFQKILSGNLTVEKECFEVAPLVEEIRTVLEPDARKNANQIDIVGEQFLGVICSDKKRVRQVLINLVGNACKFTKGGKIIVSGVRAHRDGADWLELSVADAGRGMTPEEQQRLFKPFPKITNRKDNPTGNGLGLAICKSLCEGLGGSISVTSAFGKGSTFTIMLPAGLTSEDTPAATELQPVAIVPATPRSHSGRRSVLVIDDDEVVCELMKQFLENQGFHVTTAQSGREGLALARQCPPDVITLDAVMPGIDGWAVLTALKSDPQTSAIPVIMATILDDKTRGFTLGASDYLTKPFDWKRLSEIVDRYAGQRDAGHILIVDDEEGSRQNCRDMLVQAGWHAIEAEDGMAALARVMEEPPALILLDLLMPRMDGFQFLEELRRRELGRPIPVVVVTAKDLSADDRQRLQGCVVQVLQKGAFSKDQLLQEIDRRVRHYVASLNELKETVGA